MISNIDIHWPHIPTTLLNKRKKSNTKNKMQKNQNIWKIEIQKKRKEKLFNNYFSFFVYALWKAGKIHDKKREM